MPIVGIICEYNPLHNGHAYQIRTLTSKRYSVIAIMSGNYVQRGTPAVYDKFTRTRMALAAGASMVIELPTLYSTATAENFALGAMALCKASGIVNMVSFGMEDPACFPLLLDAAKISSPETPIYQNTLRRFLDQGLPFPKAREAALSELLHAPLPTDPNHILVLEYIRAAFKLGYDPEWYPIRRKGGYHDLSAPPSQLSPDSAADQTYPSAAALRASLARGEEITSLIPEEARPYLARDHVSEDVLFPYIQYALLSMSPAELARIDEVSEGLENRIMEAILTAASYEELIDMLRSARYPTSRIRRILLNTVLGITKDLKTQLAYPEGPSYIRVLGVRKDSTDLLSRLSENAALPTLIRPVRDRACLPQPASRAFEEELRFGRLYHLFSPSYYPEELKEGLIMI